MKHVNIRRLLRLREWADGGIDGILQAYADSVRRICLDLNKPSPLERTEISENDYINNLIQTFNNSPGKDGEIGYRRNKVLNLYNLCGVQESHLTTMRPATRRARIGTITGVICRLLGELGGSDDTKRAVKRFHRMAVKRFLDKNRRG